MIQTILDSNDYYERKAKDYRIGQLGWAPVLYTPSITELRKLIFDDAGDVTGLDQVTRSNSFRNANPPIVTPIRLESNEEVLCVKAKKRPVILFSQADPAIDSVLPNSRLLDRDLRLGKIWHALPMRTYKDEHFKTLVESLYFPVFFPFIRNNICPRDDSYIRFDNIQSIHQSLIELENYTVSDEIMNMLIEAFITYTNKVEFGTNYTFYRNEFIEELKNQGVISD